MRENSGVCAIDDDANEIEHVLEDEAGAGGISQKVSVSLRTAVRDEPLPPISTREICPSS